MNESGSSTDEWSDEVSYDTTAGNDDSEEYDDTADEKEWICDSSMGCRPRLDFEGTPGVKVNFEKRFYPLRIFRKRLDDDLREMIVAETNRYAE